jgi:ribosomal protein L37E
MALVTCDDCGNRISDLAKSCPHCGRPGAQSTATPHWAKQSSRTSVTLRFQNPTNGHIEEIRNPGLWSFLFGFFYFAVHGIWTHAVAGLLLGVPTIGLSWLIYPFYAEGIVRRHYLKLGWTDVTSDRPFRPLLERLQELKESDLLNDDEFEAERRRLWGQSAGAAAVSDGPRGTAARLSLLEALLTRRQTSELDDAELAREKYKILS